MTWPGYVVKAALDWEDTFGLAVRCGLTEQEARGVITAWVDYYRTTPWIVDWSRVRLAVGNRASGRPWEPPDLNAENRPAASP